MNHIDTWEHKKLWVDATNRDLNATYNIRDWSLDVKKHAVLKQRAKYPFLDEKNLVEII
ncbi:hypothetical protein LEQ_2234 [Ligilactobacillus equi DPC 6820]|uniref:Uncharacterized protein n=1 Tax=Ligilactobacillus equi DPC 6820 TaxID=1392007 RepID=V7HYH4_9LACO|nr:hypothetical protein LEQ_2234 [Ligilactobacillus equi DPC 6820]